MRLKTNNEYYVQKGDLEFLLYNDPNFPMNLFSHVMGLGSNEDFVRITSLEEIEYLEHSGIPSFNNLYSKSDYELETEIKKIRKEMEDNIRREDTNRNTNASELIRRFKSQRKKAYYLSQYNEVLMYKRRISTMKYPDLPNPCIKPISDGIVAGGPSLERNKIIFYSLDGSSVSDKLLDAIFELTVEEFKNGLKYPREDDEIEVVKRISEVGKYLTYAVEIKHCDSKLKPFMRLFRRK